jgi:hypothetical protein
MIESVGELDFLGSNNANIPIDIWLFSPKQNKENETEYDGSQDDGSELWLLTADNYMPRKARLGGERSYKVWGTAEELRGLIKTYVLPLYETAVKYLQGMIEGKVGADGEPVFHGLYYWELPKSER